MCENLEAFGYHYDGSYAEYFVVSAVSIRRDSIKPLPDHLDYAETSVMELLAGVINGQALADFKAGESVVIMGDGPAGVLHARLAAAAEAGPICLADISSVRLQQTRALLAGAPGEVLDGDGTTFREQLMEHTDGYGCNQVMVACGAPAAQELAMPLVDKCRCVNFFGGLPHGSDPVALNINDIHYRHIRIVGTHGSTPEPNDSALSMIADHRLGVTI
jgi:L-iditol 2-dehydrogenase